MSTVKATNIQEPNSSTVNMVLNTSGGVAVGQNLSVAGTITPTSTLTLAAGTTTVAPLDFASGTNLTTALAGAMEYDGKVFYGTPQSTERGVIPGMQFFRLNATLAGANVATAQNVFGVSVTLSASTIYGFQYLYVFSKAAGTTAHSFSLLFGGSATINNILYGICKDQDSSLPGGAQSNIFASNVATATQVDNSSSTAATTQTQFGQGTVSINGGGTFTPQYILSAAPGGAYSTVAGSYFLIYPIGASGANTSVGTWA